MTVKRKPWESLDIVGAFEATSFREMTFFLRAQTRSWQTCFTSQ